jgi:hypothetical protein
MASAREAQRRSEVKSPDLEAARRLSPRGTGHRVGMKITSRIYGLGQRAAVAAAAAACILFGTGFASASETAYLGADPQAQIVCFHPAKSRFTPETHPTRCALWGDRGDTFFGISIEKLNWKNWGQNPASASGLSAQDQSPVKLSASRLVSCHDGRAFYSRVRVRVVDGGETQTLRLLTCDGPSLIR